MEILGGEMAPAAGCGQDWVPLWQKSVCEPWQERGQAGNFYPDGAGTFSDPRLVIRTVEMTYPPKFQGFYPD